MDQRDQEVTAARFGSFFVPSEPEEKVGIALHTLAELPLNALRHPPEAGTCGWYIWGGETLGRNHDFFQSMHVSHLSQYCPTLLPYLGLGPGWRVLLAPGQEEVWFDEKLLAV